MILVRIHSFCLGLSILAKLRLVLAALASRNWLIGRILDFALNFFQKIPCHGA